MAAFLELMLVTAFLGLVLVVFLGLCWALARAGRRRPWDGRWRPHRPYSRHHGQHYAHQQYLDYCRGLDQRLNYQGLAAAYLAAYIAGQRDGTGQDVVPVDRDVLVDGFLDHIGNPPPFSPEHEAATKAALYCFDVICRSRVS